MIIYLIPDNYDPGDKFKLELDYLKIDFRDIRHINFIIYCIPESYLIINNMYKRYKKNYNKYLNIVNSYEPEARAPRIIKKPKRNIPSPYPHSNKIPLPNKSFLSNKSFLPKIPIPKRN